MANQYNSKVVLATGEVLIDLTNDTIDAAHLLDGITAHDKSGAPITGSCTYDVDSSTGNATASEILSGKIAFVRGSRVTGTMPNNGGTGGTIDDVDTPFVIPQGYSDGSATVSIANSEKALLIPENIRENVTVLGVTGTMSGSEDMSPQAKSVTPRFTSQTITPDSPDYNCLSQVTVAAITVTYADNAAGGRTVTIGAA